MHKEELAWRLYSSERDFIKHHENQRTNASSILSAIYAALVVALTTGSADQEFHLLISATLAFTGAFGFVFSGKLYELIQMHASRSYEYLAIANSSNRDIDIDEIKKSVNSSQNAKFPFFSSISLNRIWFSFHALVFLFGTILTGAIYLGLV